MTARRLVVATGNRHKVDEIRRLLGSAIPEVASGALELVPMTDLGVPAPVEDGDSFEANALIKARACVAATGLPALADDSGLEVDALAGAPGVRSARFSGEDATDADNNAALVTALAGVPPRERTARFVCVAALVTVDGREVTRRGTMEGRLVDEPRGEHGFGYDPYFVADATEDGRTNGELSPAEKDAISHRGVAVCDLAEDVARWLVDT